MSRTRLTQGTREWLQKHRLRTDKQRGAETADKLIQWLKCWEAISYLWMTTATLAACLNLDPKSASDTRQLRRILHRFEAAGLIEWKRGSLKAGEAQYGWVRQKADL